MGFVRGKGEKEERSERGKGLAHRLSHLIYSFFFFSFFCRLAKRLQNAEQLLDSKEKEVVKLSDVVDKLAVESGAKLAALERIVKARNDHYRAKTLEQEGVIKRHNLAFKALQDRYKRKKRGRGKTRKAAGGGQEII